MSALCPPKNQPENDIVMTPPALAAAIVKHFAPSGIALDPCRGDGSFYNALQMAETDEVRWCELRDGKDFLSEFFQKGEVDWIITNPPWSKFVAFLSQAMRAADEVVFLATITHFVTKKRMLLIEQAGFGFKEILSVETPKSPWPQSGFQVAAVHLSRGWKGDCKFSSLQKVSD